ncbi:hypothetical protein ACIQGT_11320 [Streptomyces sp. NPDC093108]|uniref:transposase n=1 Tax=unclassified Streptomyces TaxID=2593676 RepID=UPI0033952B0B
MREYVIEHLHDGAAVLVVNEASGVKKGNHAVGVQCRTPARPRGSSSQVVVQLVYASARDRSAVDRELYIPHSWMCDPDRWRAAGPVGDTVFTTPSRSRPEGRAAPQQSRRRPCGGTMTIPAVNSQMRCSPSE